MFHYLSFVLLGQAKIYKHPKADTLYLTIPSKIAQDSAFIFKQGDTVRIRYDPKRKVLIIEPLKEKKEPLKNSNKC